MAQSKDGLGDRMKRYEMLWRRQFVPRLPLIVRVDGKAFHTLTRDLNRPFDANFGSAMHAVALALCKEIPGAMLAYTQSDEISVLVRDDQSLTTQAWFDKEADKIVSVTAGIASAEMTAHLGSGVRAVFDSRAFVLPREEVVNYFIWRQQDATRNSVSMASHAELTKKLGKTQAQDTLHNKSWAEQQEVLFATCGINWNDYPAMWKRGVCVVPGYEERSGQNGPILRRIWEIDKEIPTFTANRSYIARFIQDMESAENRENEPD